MCLTMDYLSPPESILNIGFILRVVSTTITLLRLFLSLADSFRLHTNPSSKNFRTMGSAGD